VNDNGVFGGQLFGSLFARGEVRAGDEAWLQAMLDTEAALARAVERAGLAPAGSGTAVTSIARAEFYDPATIGRAAAAIGNPVSALVKAMTALVPPDAAQAIHQGATSQDILDTAAMLLARQAITVILADLATAAGACAALAESHRATVMAGRTLLQQAVPVTFGLVAASWLTMIDEARAVLLRVKAEDLFIQYGGAAGTLASQGTKGPEIARLLAEELALRTPVLPWHTNRIPILSLAAALTTTCAALGKPARDITLLAQTELSELREGGGAPQAEGSDRRGGSSAMPHKQNPVASVVILGNTKQAPALLATIAAAAEQELQRAAGAWHSEWQPLSHLLQLTGSAAAWSADLLPHLQVDPARMRANLAATHGLPMAEHVSALLTPAMGRAEAHELVAAASARATQLNIPLDEALLSNEQAAAKLTASGLTPSDLAAALAPESYLGATQEFITRALSAHAEMTEP
jgi:3-carboxy-cis,cis-muconate cycloisomerase